MRLEKQSVTKREQVGTDNGFDYLTFIDDNFSDTVEFLYEHSPHIRDANKLSKNDQGKLLDAYLKDYGCSSYLDSDCHHQKSGIQTLLSYKKSEISADEVIQNIFQLLRENCWDDLCEKFDDIHDELACKEFEDLEDTHPYVAKEIKRVNSEEYQYGFDGGPL